MSDERLRIAMLSVHSCPLGNLGAKDTGGMSVCIRELASELGKQGHSVDVYTRVHDPRDQQVYPLGQNARLIHLKVGTDEPVPKLALYPTLPDFACSLENFRKQNDLQYDVVFSHYWLSGQVGQYLQRWWQVPHLIKFHTLGAAKNVIGIGEDEPELRLETERELVQDCQRILASTEKEKGDLVRYYGALPESITVIPCGVNMELFQPVAKEVARQRLGLLDDKFVLFVGRIEPLKGIDKLLRAIAYLENRQGLRVLIVGGDEQSQDEVARLQGLSGELGIQDSVTFLGLRKQEELPYLYSVADVCVLPSYYESFGLVALESLACGTPVIATDVGDLRSVIRQGETGYVVRDNTPRYLAEKIALLLSRSNADTESALAIRASVSGFSWSNVATAFAKECQAVLADYLSIAA